MHIITAEEIEINLIKDVTEYWVLKSLQISVHLYIGAESIVIGARCL